MGWNHQPGLDWQFGLGEICHFIGGRIIIIPTGLDGYTWSWIAPPDFLQAMERKKAIWKGNNPISEGAKTNHGYINNLLIGMTLQGERTTYLERRFARRKGVLLHIMYTKSWAMATKHNTNVLCCLLQGTGMLFCFTWCPISPSLTWLDARTLKKKTYFGIEDVKLMETVQFLPQETYAVSRLSCLLLGLMFVGDFFFEIVIEFFRFV